MANNMNCEAKNKIIDQEKILNILTNQKEKYSPDEIKFAMEAAKNCTNISTMKEKKRAAAVFLDAKKHLSPNENLSNLVKDLMEFLGIKESTARSYILTLGADSNPVLKEMIINKEISYSMVGKMYRFPEELRIKAIDAVINSVNPSEEIKMQLYKANIIDRQPENGIKPDSDDVIVAEEDGNESVKESETDNAAFVEESSNNENPMQINSVSEKEEQMDKSKSAVPLEYDDSIKDDAVSLCAEDTATKALLETDIGSDEYQPKRRTRERVTDPEKIFKLLVNPKRYYSPDEVQYAMEVSRKCAKVHSQIEEFQATELFLEAKSILFPGEYLLDLLDELATYLGTLRDTASKYFSVLSIDSDPRIKELLFAEKISLTSAANLYKLLDKLPTDMKETAISAIATSVNPRQEILKQIAKARKATKQSKNNTDKIPDNVVAHEEIESTKPDCMEKHETNLESVYTPVDMIDRDRESLSNACDEGNHSHSETDQKTVKVVASSNADFVKNQEKNVFKKQTSTIRKKMKKSVPHTKTNNHKIIRKHKRNELLISLMLKTKKIGNAVIHAAQLDKKGNNVC